MAGWKGQTASDLGHPSWGFTWHWTLHPCWWYQHCPMSSFKQKIACIEMHAIIIIIIYGPIKMHIVHLFDMSGLTSADKVWTCKSWHCILATERLRWQIDMYQCSLYTAFWLLELRLYKWPFDCWHRFPSWSTIPNGFPLNHALHNSKVTWWEPRVCTVTTEWSWNEEH